MSDDQSKHLEAIHVTDVDVDVEQPREDLDDNVGSVADIKAVIEEQDREAEQFALAFLKSIVRLRGVRIDRERFLKAELHKRGVADGVIDSAVSGNPATAGISALVLDQMAESAIDFETRKSTALSFAAGLPALRS